MLVVNAIERAHVDSIPLLFGAVGLGVLLISLQPYTGGIGYRGIAFLCYGKRIWQFSNRLFGSLFFTASMILYLWFKFGEPSASNKVICVFVACVLCIIVSDGVTLYLKKCD